MQSDYQGGVRGCRARMTDNTIITAVLLIQCAYIINVTITVRITGDRYGEVRSTSC